MLLGVDVSNHQGVVNWDSVAATGRPFAFCKASEGTTYRDKYLTRNRAEMKRVGFVLRGLYDFARPGRNSARAEADFFLKCIDGYLGPGEVAVLDMEDGSDQLTAAQRGAWSAEWLDRVAAVTGKMPGFYTYAAFPVDTAPLVSRSWYWAAAYGSTVPKPRGWPRWTFWQFTSSGSVPGIAGRCDENRFWTDDVPKLAELSGAPAQGDWFDMATKAELIEAVREVIQDADWQSPALVEIPKAGEAKEIPYRYPGVIWYHSTGDIEVEASWVYVVGGGYKKAKGQTYKSIIKPDGVYGGDGRFVGNSLQPDPIEGAIALLVKRVSPASAGSLLVASYMQQRFESVLSQ